MRYFKESKKPLIEKFAEFVYYNGLQIALSFIGAIVIFVILDIATGKTVKNLGTVIDKIYIPERDYVTISTTTNSQGHVSSHPVFHHDPAEYKFIVRSKFGDIVKVEGNVRNFYNTKIDDELPYATRYGGISNSPYFRLTIDY